VFPYVAFGTAAPHKERLTRVNTSTAHVVRNPEIVRYFVRERFKAGDASSRAAHVIQAIPVALHAYPRDPQNGGAA
jgi:hypothetical protein